MPHSSLAIANEFLRLAQVEEQKLTHMQVQKLVYLAHGWNLAVNNQPLISDQIEAWEFGPVIRRLYDALRSYGKKPIQNFINWGDDTPFDLDDDGAAFEELSVSERSVIDEVWKNYGRFEAFQLSALTHEDGSPWSQTYKSSANRPIDDELIKKYFVDIATGTTGAEK